MNTYTVLDDLGPRGGDGQPNETKQHGVCMYRWREVTCPSHLGQQEPLQWRCIFFTIIYLPHPTTQKRHS